MRNHIQRPSPALVVSLIALFVALGGTGYAAVKIGTKQLKNNAVTAKKIKRNAVTAAKIKNGAVTGPKIKGNAVTGAKINESTLGTVPSAATAATADTAKSAGSVSGLGVIPLKRATPTNGATQADARTAAPKVPLFSKGQLSIYGKCFSSGGTLWVGTYIESSVNGAIFDSRGEELTGGAAASDFLNPDSAETDREIDEDSATADDATFDNEDDNDFSAVAPDGTTLRGLLLHGAKQGNVALSGGAYGSGDGCLWGGFVTG